jgi:putative heme-binding domain-containing protein
VSPGFVASLNAKSDEGVPRAERVVLHPVDQGASPGQTPAPKRRQAGRTPNASRASSVGSADILVRTVLPPREADKNVRAPGGVFSRILALALLLCVAPALHSAAGSTDADQAAINMEALSRLKDIDLDANPSVKAVVLKLLKQAQGTPQFVDIVRDFKIKDQEEGLIQVAAREPASQSGVESMKLVLSNGKLDLLKEALKGTNAVRIAEALGNTDEKAMVPLLQPIVTDTGRDLALRKQSVKALSRVQEGAGELLELAKAQKLPDDLRLTASMELNGVRWENLKALASQVLPMPQGHDAKPLPPITELVKMTGDVQRGSNIFRSEMVGCSKCHQVNGVGTDFGPNLSEIGTKLAKEAIYEAILDPSAGISFGFEAWQLELKDGDEGYGIIVSETADDVALKAVGGVVTRYKKADIAKRTQQKLSIMPAGLEKTMSVSELADLVQYLSSLKKAVKNDAPQSGGQSLPGPASPSR